MDSTSKLASSHSVPSKRKPNWKKIRDAYRSGECQTLKECSERFGVSMPALMHRSSREGWRTLDNHKLCEKVAEKAVEKASDLIAKGIQERVTRWVGDVDGDRDAIQASYAQMGPAADPDAVATLIGARSKLIGNGQALGAVPRLDDGRSVSAAPQIHIYVPQKREDGEVKVVEVSCQDGPLMRLPDKLDDGGES